MKKQTSPPAQTTPAPSSSSKKQTSPPVQTAPTKKEPIVLSLPIPDDKKPGEALGQTYNTPSKVPFTASIPKQVAPGQKTFHVLVDEGKKGTQVAKSVATVKGEPVDGKISLVEVPIPQGSKAGSTLGPFKAPSGKEFKVEVPSCKKPGEKLTVIVDESVKKGESQIAKSLKKDEVVMYVDVPRGKKEGDYIGNQLTPGKRDFVASVPKGRKAGDKVPFIVKDADPSGGGCCGCFSGFGKKK